jgi:hypothetical protein
VKVLFTGRGTSGSWQIRGEQMAAALGADARAAASRWSLPQLGGVDFVVVVKRIDDTHLKQLHAQGARIVWDIVDAWPQPAGNRWDKDEALCWLADQVKRIRPAAIIAATHRMAKDCARFGVPVLWLRHHHRPHILPNPIRDRITLIGYEGASNYVESWARIIQRECNRIGARFVMQPDHLADVDIVLGLRDYVGYPARQWKSGVKLANAHGSGTPFIGGREAGYMETASGAEYWADSADELRTAIDWLRDPTAREQVADRFREKAYSVDKAAADLRAFLCSLR